MKSEGCEDLVVHYKFFLHGKHQLRVRAKRASIMNHWDMIPRARHFISTELTSSKLKFRIYNDHAQIGGLFDGPSVAGVKVIHRTHCVYANMLISRANYVYANHVFGRKIGERQDDPACRFPNDGNFCLDSSAGRVWFMVYISGDADRAWMNDKYKNYKSRINRERSVNNEKKDSCPILPRQNSIAREIVGSSSNFIKGTVLQHVQQELIKIYHSETGIQLMFYHDIPFELDELFVSLQVVTRRKQIKQGSARVFEHGKDLRVRHLHHYEDITAVKKEAIELVDLLSERDKQHKRKIIIEGRAGVGKSTLCKRIAYCWSHPEPAKQLWREHYDWVFWIRLREFTGVNSPASCINDEVDYLLAIVHQQCFKRAYLTTEEKVALKKLIVSSLRDKQSRVLWLLDGYDEFHGRAHAYQFVQNAFKALENSPHFMLTSRPHVYEITSHQDLSLEVTGLTNEKVDRYIDKFLHALEESKKISVDASRKAKQVLAKLLSQRQDIKSIAYVPINLELLCSIVVKRVDYSEATADSIVTTLADLSLSNLYGQLVESLYIRRYERDHPALNVQEVKKKIFTIYDIVEKHYEETTRFLECFAYEGMCAKVINLDDKTFEQAYQRYQSLSSHPMSKENLLKELEAIGVMNSLQDSGEQSFEFLHLTFQEWFAARFMARMLSCDWGNTKRSVALQKNNKEIIEFIKDNKLLPFYTVQMHFTAGILAQRDDPDHRGINTFFKLLQSTPICLLPSHVNEMLMQCLEAAQLSMHIEQQETILDTIKQYLTIKFSKKNMERFYYGDNCEDYSVLPNVLKRAGLIDALVDYLFDEDEIIRSGAAFVLGQLGVKGEAVIAGLKVLATDQPMVARYNAVNALAKLGMQDKAVRDKLVTLLLDKALRQESYYVLSAVPTLVNGPIGDAVIAAMLSKLSDEDESVRGHAAAALGRLGVKNEDVITNLRKCLNDQDHKVRRNAANALGNLGAKDEAVVVALEELLLDTDKGVRVYAARALGLLGVVKDKAVIDGLVRVLGKKGEECWLARHSAAMALGQLCVQDEVVITGLLQRLTDEDWYVRRAASTALGQLGVKKEAVITALVERLSDEYEEDEDVGDAALKALKQLSVNGLALSKSGLLKKNNINLLTVFELISLRDAFELYFEKAHTEFLEPLCKRLVADNVLMYFHNNSFYYMDFGKLEPINVFSDPARQKRFKTFIDCLRDRVGRVLNDESYSRGYFDQYIIPTLFNKPKEESPESQENKERHTNQGIQSVSHSDPALFLNLFKIKQKVQNDVVYFQLNIDYTALDEQLALPFQKVLSKKLGLQSIYCFDYKKDKAGRVAALSFITESSTRQLFNVLTSNSSLRVKPQKSSSINVFHFHGPTQLSHNTGGNSVLNINEVKQFNQY